MGVGKTTVGKVLAENLNYNFVDIDDKKHWIKFGYLNGARDVFWNDIEKYYDTETNILREISENSDKNCVISTGGSIVLREENINLMKSSGIIIFLNANAKIINDRIKNSYPPKLWGASFIQGQSVEDQEEFMKGRESKYKIANLKIDTNNKSIEEVSHDIIFELKLSKDELKSNKFVKMSWLRDEDVYPIVPNIDVFVNWLMDIKEHRYFDKFNYYLTGGFISWPEKTKDIDIIITKRNGQHAKLKELEELMVDMFDSAYDTHGFFLDTFYMRIPQWIADYPRNREILKSVERKQLFITITKNEDKGIVCKYKRYGKLNCCYMSSFGPLSGWDKEDSSLIYRWVDLDSEYAKWADLRRIIKYYENDKKRNIEDFKEKFQEYSGY